jgi:hypothetical protein
MSRGIRIAAVCAAVTVIFGVVPAAYAATPTPDSPDELLNAVKNGPNAKIGAWLGNLSNEYREAAGKGVAAKAFKSTNPMLHVSKGNVGITAYANNAAALVKSLQAMGATKIKARGPLVSAQVPVKSLSQLAALPSLRQARPVLAMTDALPPKAVTQGDISLNGPQARANAGVDGTGVKVGLLSDSIECNPPPFNPGAPNSSFDEDISNDELPTDTTILDNGACPGSDEGRGMAQLVHDVAPGASIAFHTAFNSEFDFAEGIIELADAGANVIADDVRYFDEPFFSDGMVAQAVDIVTGRGVAYYSSAGNQKRDSYSSDFHGINVAVNPGTKLKAGKVIRRFHNFGTAQAPSILQPVDVTPDAAAGLVIISFQWDQPHLTATTYARIKAGQDPSLAVGATSDLDLVFYDYKFHVVRNCPDPDLVHARGITCQITGDRNIGGDAVDIAALFYSGPPKIKQRFYIALVKSGGPDPGVVKTSWFVNQGTFLPQDFVTNSPTSFGHSNAAGNQAVGAASWYVTVPFSTSGLVPPNDTQTPKIDLSPCAPACLNDFSSAGGIPILFDKFGTRLGSPEIRQVPSVTGPDGGNTSFFLADSSYDDDDGDGLNSPTSIFISCCDRPGDEYPNFFGTSASTPHVAAVAALMLQKKPDLTVQQIREALQNTARPISLRFTSARPTITFPINKTGPGTFDFDSGYGLVDAAAALGAIGN